eukprot:2971394-Rhodomonas_salina.5
MAVPGPEGATAVAAVLCGSSTLVRCPICYAMPSTDVACSITCLRMPSTSVTCDQYWRRYVSFWRAACPVLRSGMALPDAFDHPPQLHRRPRDHVRSTPLCAYTPAMPCPGLTPLSAYAHATPCPVLTPLSA